MNLTPFATTGRMVSVVGLGGEGVLWTDNRGDEAVAVIRAAVAGGSTYFDSARPYFLVNFRNGAV